jgi:arabinogalactan oligomer/maltooligosaccharide transport system permease protein
MAIDLSRPAKDFLPKGAKSTPGGLLKSVALLLLALGTATLVGIAGVVVLAQLIPDVPFYTGIVFGLAALVPTLYFIARRYEWIMPWYYLLPAILFLLTFTLFPVVLTVLLAFTDYAYNRNGELSIGTTTPIVQVDDTLVQLENTRNLACEILRGPRQGCNDVRAVVFASGTFETQGVSLDGNVLTVEPAPPPGNPIGSVNLLIPAAGFRAQFTVTSVDGHELTLERAPPPGASLEDVQLELDQLRLERRILRVDGDTVVLDEPLPDTEESGLAYEAVARYNDFGWIGWDNFRAILRQATSSLGPVFAWNVLFATGTIIINTIFGVFLAVLLNNPNLRFRNAYRTLLIIPWALPAIITIQVWRGFLNTNFGAINRFLALMDLPTYDWLGDPSMYALYPKAAVLLVNLWLGLPFIMTATLGALSAIPTDLYEAATIDGASPWQSFWGVTAPLLRTALVPITLTGFAFNFNNFNIIYLLTDGGPSVPWGTETARGTDILISWAYNEAFRAQGGYQYGLGSAISILIFLITLAISLVNFRVTGALKEESNA